MDKKLQQLVSVYRVAAQKEAEPASADTVNVNELVSKAASVYEVVRNTLEYSEAHLLRRNAIRRILRRRLNGDDDVKRIADELLQELIWARYLPNKTIPLKRQDETAAILEKYVPLFHSAEISHDRKRLSLWLLDLVSTEIEYLLMPPRREEALVSFVYSLLKDTVEWPKNTKLKDDEKELQLFVGIHRTLLKSNQATLRYRTFNLFYPKWGRGSDDLVKEIATNLSVVHQAVERHVHHPMGETLSRKLKSKMALFKVLHDIILEHAGEMDVITSDSARLASAVKKAASGRYDAFRARLSRLVMRAVLFLFFTKMILAFIIELPYEVFILKDDNYVPLLVNILFHPVLLAILGLTGTIPEKKNTERLIESIDSLVAGGKSEFKLKIQVKKPWARGTVGFIFNMLYALTFVFSYGLITVLLIALHFNILSIILFLLFLSLVMFLGITIRRSRMELVVVSGKSGMLMVVGDFFTLPVIRAGRWISMRTPRINVFLFFLDFIVEAPFKMAIQIIEGWLAFMKEKKEDIGVEH